MTGRPGDQSISDQSIRNSSIEDGRRTGDGHQCAQSLGEHTFRVYAGSGAFDFGQHGQMLGPRLEDAKGCVHGSYATWSSLNSSKRWTCQSRSPATPAAAAEALAALWTACSA